EANQKLAQAYNSLQNLGEARRHLEREVTLYPSSYSALCDLGDVLWRLGDYPEAQQRFSAARRIDSNDPRALVALAAADRRLGNYEAARASIREILSRIPDNIRANLEMGLIFLDEKKYTEA